MSLNRFAKRRDANEPELVQVAREIGALMEQAPPLDWWCFFRDRWVPVEIKNPEGHHKGDGFTREQILFRARCKERAAPMWKWETVDDVLESLNARQTA